MDVFGNICHFAFGRVCRLPGEGVRGLTEDCFQNNPLRFVGRKTWLRTLHDSGTADKWRTVVAERTTENTWPEGSEWTKVAEPNRRMGMASRVRKDLVRVPRNLSPGRYVLSFRWDCENTSQVMAGAGSGAGAGAGAS